MGKPFLYILLAVFIISGCGPEETSKEIEDQESADEIAEKTRIYKQFEGGYLGQMVGATGETIYVKLVLEVFNIYVPNPKDNTIDEIPNLTGSFSYCSNSKNKNCKNGTWTQLADFDRGAFDKKVTVLAMTGQTQVGKRAQLSLTSTKDGFEGTFSGGIRSEITLVKVSP